MRSIRRRSRRLARRRGRRRARTAGCHSIVAAAQPVREDGDLTAPVSVQRRDQRHAAVEERRRLPHEARRDGDVRDRDQMPCRAEPQGRRRAGSQEHGQGRDRRQGDEPDEQVEPVRLPDPDGQKDQRGAAQHTRHRAPPANRTPARPAVADGGPAGRRRPHHRASQPSCSSVTGSPSASSRTACGSSCVLQPGGSARRSGRRTGCSSTRPSCRGRPDDAGCPRGESQAARWRRVGAEQVGAAPAGECGGVPSAVLADASTDGQLADRHLGHLVAASLPTRSPASYISSPSSRGGDTQPHARRCRPAAPGPQREQLGHPAVGDPVVDAGVLAARLRRSRTNASTPGGSKPSAAIGPSRFAKSPTESSSCSSSSARMRTRVGSPRPRKYFATRSGSAGASGSTNGA